MALQHLPRPWLLAALAEVPMTLLAQEEDERPDVRRREDVLPRPEARRRRPSSPRSAGQWYGEDCWQGVDQWHEGERRAN
jgi:hypothetical protein